mmetsp:Transcript_28267/g.66432  ORF Transcript_28267/g.66432 Transcript_28267/m.66432 type:complete len:88 (-) Transcript_28267:11-274(-)
MIDVPVHAVNRILVEPYVASTSSHVVWGEVEHRCCTDAQETHHAASNDTKLLAIQAAAVLRTGYWTVTVHRNSRCAKQLSPSPPSDS